MGPDAPRCRDHEWACDQLVNSACTSFLESESTALMAELDRVGKVSASQKKPIGGTVGPYVEYYSWGIAIIGWFEGSTASDCPATADDTWSDGQRVSCAVFRDF